jgi:dihydroorotase
MTIMLTRATTPSTVIEAAKRGVKILKFIPLGVSTNSDESVGMDELGDFYFLLEAAQQSDIVFSGHWEALRLPGKDEDLPNFHRETAAIGYLDKIVRAFPRLRIVVEHASTKRMIDYIKQAPLNVRATLTLQHAYITLSDVCDGWGNIINPYNYCKPIVKSEEDRVAVMQAMISGDPHFFFGSDTAPHPRSAKGKNPPAAGIDSSLVAKAILVQIFEDNNALKNLNGFTNSFGAEFYGLPKDTAKIEMVKQDWVVPQEHEGIVPFMAGKTLHWQIAE